MQSMFHVSPTRAPFPVRLILLYLIAPTIIGKEYKSRSPSPVFCHLLASSFTQISVGLFPRSEPNTVSDVCRNLWTEGGPHTSRTGPSRGAAAVCRTVTVQCEPRTGRSESWFVHWFVYLKTLLGTALTNQNCIKSRLHSEYSCLHSVQNVLYSVLLAI